ncbi:MAG TPA: PAS domain S-box protein, partial [Polyangiaceae bacterium]|nr:PAS domain S-box protein [Polyangiaceae bacterium]
MTFASKIIELEQRLNRIRHESGQYQVAHARVPAGADEVVTPAALDETMEELSTTLEELRTLEEELIQRNQSLYETQQGLSAERRRYHDLFEFAPDACLVSTELGVILEANRATYGLFSTAPANLLNKPLTLFLAERPQRAELSNFMSEVRQSGRPCTIELELRRMRNGGTFPASFQAAPLLEQERCVGIRWVIRDITQQKRAQRDAELVALVSASTDPIISLGLDGCIQAMNPAAERLYGYASRALVGKPVSVLFSDARVPELLAILEQIEQHAVRSLETVHVTRSGATLQVQVSATMILDGTGHPKSIAMFVHDISASKQIETLLRERTLHLMESDRRKNVFLGLLAHELRNPLSAVLGAVELFGEPLLPASDRA